MTVAVRSFSVATLTNSTVSVAVPTGAAINDIMIAFASEDGGTVHSVSPAGWTQLDFQYTTSPDGQSATVYWKRLTAADTGTYTFTNAGGNALTIAVICLSGADTTNPPVVGTVTKNTTSNASPVTVSAAGITVGVGDAIVYLGALDPTSGPTVTWTTPSGFTDAASGGAGTYSIVYTGTKIASAAGSTGTVSAVATASGMHAGYLSWLVQVPAPSGGGGGIDYSHTKMGATNISGMYLGSTGISALYLGSTQIF